MAITVSQLKKYNTSCNISNIEAKLLYPRLILFENKLCVKVVNLLGNNVETQESSEYHTFDEEIADTILHDQFLWLVFKSGNIIAIDVVKGVQIKVTNDTNTCLKICQIGRIENRLHFISESGDTFLIPLNTSELVKKLGESTKELSVPFKKAHVSHSRIKTRFDSISGLNISIEEGSVMVRCPFTGIMEIISTQTKFNDVVTWRDQAIFANKSNMWIVDMKESQVVYEFEKTDENYYPVLAHNDLFYYILWNKEEVQIYCAGFAQSQNHGGAADHSDSFNQTLTSQDTLKVQLKTLIDSITSATKPGIEVGGNF
ncbi:hypothetical protein PYW08_007110 [Mythimna loreyi]|uniref:Uncharacterized protein n=1 Tax=Mythimna loreyi TaxID=667449 RepID=A0ACC2R8Q5_9NEOP|nr:hypothetical protein PYW08_007110 [Mythimna loreyi]